MNNIKSHYQALFREHGKSPKTLQYSSKESQFARFRILSEIASREQLSGSSVLDYGCGLGDLAGFFAEQGIDIQYTGVDIVEEFISAAQENFPHHRFCKWEEASDNSYDWAFVSGVFNNKMTNNRQFFEQTIRDLLKVTKRGVAINLMSSYVDYEDPDLWYVKPEEVFAFVKTLTPFIVIRNDYLVKKTPVPFEFAVYAYHHPYIA